MANLDQFFSTYRQGSGRTAAPAAAPSGGSNLDAFLASYRSGQRPQPQQQQTLPPEIAKIAEVSSLRAPSSQEKFVSKLKNLLEQAGLGVKEGATGTAQAIAKLLLPKKAEEALGLSKPLEETFREFKRQPSGALENVARIGGNIVGAAPAIIATEGVAGQALGAARAPALAQKILKPAAAFTATSEDRKQGALTGLGFGAAGLIPGATAAQRVGRLATQTGVGTAVPLAFGATPQEAAISGGIAGLLGVPGLKAPRTVAEPIPKSVTKIPELKSVDLIKPKTEVVIPGVPKTKVSRLAQGVEAKAVESKLTKGFEGLPEYETVNMKQQAELASNLLRKEPTRAVEIALGKRVPPAEILPESVFTAVENQALKQGNVEVLRKLATESSLSTEATSMGQRIRALAERNPDSAVGAMKQITDTRVKAIEERSGKKVKEVVKETANTIKQEIKKPTRQDWTGFIEELRCK